jgi:hypothetical protein
MVFQNLVSGHFVLVCSKYLKKILFSKMAAAQHLKSYCKRFSKGDQRMTKFGSKAKNALWQCGCGTIRSRHTTHKRIRRAGNVK